MKVWVSGFPRSGTTVLGRVLGSRKHAEYVGEVFNTDFPVPGCAFRARHFMLRLKDGEPDGEGDIRQLQEFMEGRAGLSPVRKRDLKYPKHLLRRLTSAYGRLPWAERGTFVVIKDPTAFYSLDVLTRNLGVRPVVVIRDPVEVAGSFLIRRWLPDLSPILAQTNLSEWVDPLQEHVDRIKGKDFELDVALSVAVLWEIGHRILLDSTCLNDVVVVWHHQFKRDPVVTTSRLLGRLGLQIDDECRRGIESFCQSKPIPRQSEVTSPRDVRRDLSQVGKQAASALGEDARSTVRSICQESWRSLGEFDES